MIFNTSNSNFFKEVSSEYFLEFSQILMIKKSLGDQLGVDFYSDIIKIKSHLHYFYIHEKEILEEFYNQNEISHPDWWLLEIYKILIIANDYNNISFGIEQNHWIEKYCNKILINKLFGQHKINDVDLKMNSLYKEDNKYFVLNWSHFGQHLLYSITYQLYQLYRKKYNPKLKFDTYKSMISEEVSEKISFRKSIEKCFGRKGTFIKYDDGFFSGFPDCYLRYNKSIFIFEFKDSSLSKEFIEDESYIKTKEFIDERFIKNKKSNKPKGISQLAAAIDLIDNELQIVDSNLFNKYKKSSLELFPILVVSEPMFSHSAVESYLTKEFNTIKPKSTGFKRINDLVVINYSFLVNYFLNAEKRDLFVVIKKYVSKKNNYKPKGLLPDFPTIETISYPKISKAKQLIDISNELPITDLNLDEQLKDMQNKEQYKKK
ncbi:hypothetical protein ACTS93_01440 [Empedobacter falsenii]